MGQTKAGSQKTKAANLAKDPQFYQKLGALGGRGDQGNVHKKGFGTHRQTAVEFGRKYGKITKSGWAKYNN